MNILTKIAEATKKVDAKTVWGAVAFTASVVSMIGNSKSNALARQNDLETLKEEAIKGAVEELRKQQN